jgi:hypothetical protein
MAILNSICHRTHKERWKHGWPTQTGIKCQHRYRRVNETLLTTTLTKVEYILNSRPLDLLVIGSSDPRPITANDFLIPWAKKDPEPIPEIISTVKIVESNQQSVGQIMESFVKQMIPTLHRLTVKERLRRSTRSPSR